ncbi:MAG TPA: class I SAM-dependent methyltransferase [Longimicrobium sp.]|uniref:class I SAM-dependent methyltransferase n=1 Tax=Longimicrobium sp. TaxID=2029185 RepID=UPI002EDB3016
MTIPNAVAERDPMWEEVPECGACGSDRWRAAGEVCGKRFARCAECGVVRLYDRVAASQLHRLYAGYYPDEDPSPEELRSHLANPTFAHRRTRLEAAMPPSRRRIFEVGCGDGNFLAYLRGHEWQVHGSEYDPHTVELVRRRHGIELFTGDVVGGAPAGAPFDVVAAYHVLEHVYQPAEWLRALRRMLRPGGVVHLQVPNHGSLTRKLTGAAWGSVMFPQHVYFYSPRTLAALLRREGFTPLSTTTWDPWHGPGAVAGSLVNVVRRGTGRGLPWSDALGAEDRVDASAGEAPARGRPSLGRRVLDGVAARAARVEALAGAGAVVDVIARAG